jgi:hypothetical protein
MSDELENHLGSETGRKDELSGKRIREIVENNQGKSQMDFIKALVIELKASRDEYKARKFQSDVADYIVSGIESILIEAFTEANEDKIHVKDVGTCYISRSYKARVPASQDQKLALYQYIQHKYGEARLEDMRSINYQKLNSFINEEAKAQDIDKKDIKIPGIEGIELQMTIGMRKS